MKARVLSHLAVVLILSSCSTVKEISPEGEQQPGPVTQPAAKLTPAIPAEKLTKPTKPAVVLPKKPVEKVPAVVPTEPVPNVPVPPKVEIPEKPVKPVVDTPAKPQMPGSRVSRVSVSDKVVALTFDDGPHGGLTPRVLDILGRYNAKGTFFVLGKNAKSNPALLRRMVSSGHEVGSHTWNHMNMSRNSRGMIEADLIRTNEAIVSACGVTPRVMRPPYGAGNASLASWVKERFGSTTVLWDVDTNDWRKPGVQTVINRAVNGARPGSIILVHDIHKSTVDAVEGIVKGLQARGFRLVTVSELMNKGRSYARKPAPVIPATPAIPAIPSVSEPEVPAPVSIEPNPVDNTATVGADSSPEGEADQSDSAI